MASPLPSKQEDGIVATHRPALYYGWVMVGTLSITELISWGVTYYAFSVMIAPMQAELGWTSASITGAFSLALLCSAVGAVPVGRLLDRYGPRHIMTVGSLAAALLVFAWAQVHTLWSFYLLWMLLGFAMAAILYEPAFVVVATWFERKRQHALTLLTFGGGLASVVFVPLTTVLVEQLGWRLALIVLSIVLAVLTIPLHALLLRRHPHDLGLVCDGVAPMGAIAPCVTEPKPSMSVRGALRETTFWWLALAFSLSILTSVAVSVHLIAHLTERGYSASFRATAAALLGGAQIPGRLVFTPLGAYVSRQRLAVALFVMQVAAFLVLLSWSSTAGILFFALLFGAGAGALTPARGALVADFFGVEHYGGINGALAFVTTLARSIAPVSAGLIYTISGSYQPLWWTLLALILLGMIAMLQVRQPITTVSDHSPS